MVLIFLLSNQDKGESRQTSGLIIRLLEWFQLDLETMRAWHIPTLVRKLAHFTEYAILYFFAYRVVSLYKNDPFAKYISLIICVLYAASDEWHQTFIPGRDAKILDMGIDSLGAIVAMLALPLLTKWWRRIF